MVLAVFLATPSFHKFKLVVGSGGWKVSLSLRLSILQASYFFVHFVVQQ